MLNNPLKYTDPDGLEALRIGRAAYDSVSAGVSEWYETNFTPVDHYGSSGQPFLPRMDYLDSDQPLISQSIQNNLIAPAYNLAADIWNTPLKVQTGHATDMEMVETAMIMSPASKTVTTGLNYIASKASSLINNVFSSVFQKKITDPKRLLTEPKYSHPHLDGGPIYGVELPKGYKYNQAVSTGQKSPGQFGTPSEIPSIDFVRNELAVTPGMKQKISGSRIVEVVRPVRAQISVIGPQKFNNVIYPGRKTQFQTLQYDAKNPFVKFTGKETPLQ